MKEGLPKPLTEYERRFQALPANVRVYLTLGKHLEEPDISEARKGFIKSHQLGILVGMPDIEREALFSFIGWRDNEQRDTMR